jgi:hypothetical protein
LKASSQVEAYGSDRVDAPQRPQCAKVEVLMSTT